mgnify:CR=1 FL=1
MMGGQTNLFVATTHLLPERHPQKELFICDVADAVLKDIMPQMEHPFYSLSKKPDTQIRRYEHNGNWLEITPSVKGLATIYDKDILIYCISQIIAKLKRGERISSRVQINCHELLVFTNRGTGGKDYKALCESLDRLAGTRIVTNIQTGGEEERSSFGLIDASTIRRKHGLDGRLVWCEIQLSDWIFNAIREKEVLTLHPDYFRLARPLEKRIYEIARKHCGQQASWSIDIENLLKKSGSLSPLKRFKQRVKDLAKANHLPDYKVALERNLVVFLNRKADKAATPPPLSYQEQAMLQLTNETFQQARHILPDWDIYRLEQEWQDWWVQSGKPYLAYPDKAFLGFCTKRAKKAR